MTQHSTLLRIKSDLAKVTDVCARLVTLLHERERWCMWANKRVTSVGDTQKSDVSSEQSGFFFHILHLVL